MLRRSVNKDIDKARDLVQLQDGIEKRQQTECDERDRVVQESGEILRRQIAKPDKLQGTVEHKRKGRKDDGIGEQLNQNGETDHRLPVSPYQSVYPTNVFHDVLFCLYSVPDLST